MKLERIEVITGDNPTGAVIWLHGLGADGHDFEPIVPELKLPEGLAIRFIFPHAPVREVTINGGAEMRAWYDIDPGAPVAGSNEINEAAERIRAIIDEVEADGIDSHRVVLAGFSQGGVIALHLGLRLDRPLAGIMGLSTYLHDHEHLTDELTLANVDVSIFMAHGLMDPMIPITRGVTSREALLALGYQVEWHEYGMGHAVCLEEINDIARWLNARFR
jgi:phospholipase/carboxylesterase